MTLVYCDECGTQLTSWNTNPTAYLKRSDPPIVRYWNVRCEIRDYGYCGDHDLWLVPTLCEHCTLSILRQAVEDIERRTTEEEPAAVAVV